MLFCLMGTRRGCSILGILSNIIMWCCVGLLTGRTQGAGNTLREAEPALTHDQILIALPVYVTSIIATAIFTWTIAQYDRKRDKKLDRIEHINDDLRREISLLKEHMKRSGGPKS
mgnify:CR=1 FL=1